MKSPHGYFNMPCIEIYEIVATLAALKSSKPLTQNTQHPKTSLATLQLDCHVITDHLITKRSTFNPTFSPSSGEKKRNKPEQKETTNYFCIYYFLAFSIITPTWVLPPYSKFPLLSFTRPNKHCNLLMFLPVFQNKLWGTESERHFSRSFGRDTKSWSWRLRDPARPLHSLSTCWKSAVPASGVPAVSTKGR